MPPTSHQPPSDDFPFLDGRHTGNLIRLGRLLEHPSRFRLVLAEHNAPPYRDRIIARLADRFPRSTTWPIPPDLSAGDLIEHLRDLGPGQEAVQIIGFEDCLPEAESRLFVGLNHRREDLAAAAPLLLVLWLPKGAVTRFAQEAPDLWAWCTAVLDFALAPSEHMEIHHRTLAFRGEDAERLRARRREISEHLEAKGEPTHADGALLLEAARIHERFGEWDQALEAAGQALAIYRDNDDQRGVALALGATADILQDRGELDEALRIRTQEELPVYERLGDVREKAVTQGKIADILQARGELDQALRILTDEVLGAFERLGDVREKAVTQGQIADILQARGQLDEALALHGQCLAVARKLGDLDLVAATRFKIARIRFQRREQETGAIQQIHEGLAESFAIVRKLGRQDGIGHVGILLAQVLALRGQQDEAFEVLDQAEAAFTKLGDAQGADQARQSRDRIRAGK